MLRKSWCLQTKKWDVRSSKITARIHESNWLESVPRSPPMKPLKKQTFRFSITIWLPHCPGIQDTQESGLKPYLTLILQTHSCRQTGLSSEYILHVLIFLFCICHSLHHLHTYTLPSRPLFTYYNSIQYLRSSSKSLSLLLCETFGVTYIITNYPFQIIYWGH